MRTIVGNWKMNMSRDEATSFVKELRTKPLNKDRLVILAAPFTLITTLAQLTLGSDIQVCAQNMHFADKGAYTGEVSPLLIKDAGASYVIIGHSERRKIFRETDDIIAKKLKSAFSHGITPIFCLGETEEERKKGLTFQILKNQLLEGLSQTPAGEFKNIFFAYEPVWAIGTGVTAEASQVDEVHLFLKDLIRKNCFNNSLYNAKILYGGSVSPENIEGLMKVSSIDGVLVGGASLKVESFLPIINFKE